MYYDEDRKVKKSKPFWLYVLVILIYFLLIGIVIAVLLLAPKYPSLTSEVTLHQEHPPIHLLPEETPVIVPDIPSYSNEKPFRPSPLDPLYTGIDPRRYVDNSTSERELHNSKLLLL